jgi:hypothetical protein
MRSSNTFVVVFATDLMFVAPFSLSFLSTVRDLFKLSSFISSDPKTTSFQGLLVSASSKSTESVARHVA